MTGVMSPSRPIRRADLASHVDVEPGQRASGQDDLGMIAWDSDVDRPLRHA